jgi:hypothetical protein
VEIKAQIAGEPLPTTTIRSSLVFSRCGAHFVGRFCPVLDWHKL